MWGREESRVWQNKMVVPVLDQFVNVQWSVIVVVLVWDDQSGDFAHYMPCCFGVPRFLFCCCKVDVGNGSGGCMYVCKDGVDGVWCMDFNDLIHLMIPAWAFSFMMSWWWLMSAWIKLAKKTPSQQQEEMKTLVKRLWSQVMWAFILFWWDLNPVDVIYGLDEDIKILSTLWYLTSHIRYECNC